MIKVRVEKSAFLLGVGFYLSKKSWNISAKRGNWFGPSLAVHLFNRIIRICWIISEELK